MAATKKATKKARPARSVFANSVSDVETLARMLYEAAAGPCISAHALPVPAAGVQLCANIQLGADQWADVFIGEGFASELILPWVNAFVRYVRLVPYSAPQWRQGAVIAAVSLANWIPYEAPPEQEAFAS